MTTLRKGDVLLGAAGKSLGVADPRVPLGEAIGTAEASDGNLVFEAQRDGKPSKVVVALPALGAYADDWLAGCKKSAAIITANARYIAG
jgi:hypothetical protein